MHQENDGKHFFFENAQHAEKREDSARVGRFLLFSSPVFFPFFRLQSKFENPFSYITKQGQKVVDFTSVG